jgi:23S rRNA (uracil1939-C5)-methyltransferase
LLLTIEKLIYGGDGLGRLPKDEHGRGKAVFAPFVLQGEKIEGRIIDEKAGFARASADAIIGASSQRRAPLCPYFTRCGGCHYQHASYEHQLEIKKEILRETLRRTAKIELPAEIEVHPSPPWNYRNRSRLQIRTRPEFMLGYFKPSSQEVLAVEQCPISSPLINRAISSVWKLGRDGRVPEGVREIEFFANSEDAEMLVELSCGAAARRAAVREFAEELRVAMPVIAGVAAMREAAESAGSHSTSSSRSFLPKKGKKNGGLGASQKLIAIGTDHLVYRTKAATYRVSAGSFFQTNRFMIDELVRIVTQERAGESALDLYAGVGLFSTALGDVRHTVSVESSQTSSSDLSYNLPSNGKAVQATTEQYLSRWENSERFGKGAVLPHSSYLPDLAVVDPPRNGLGERVARLLVKLGAPVLTYVSCDPATLARDLAVLLAGGYCIERAHLVDLFPQTYHIESVVKLRKGH